MLNMTAVVSRKALIELFLPIQPKLFALMNILILWKDSSFYRNTDLLSTHVVILGWLVVFNIIIPEECIEIIIEISFQVVLLSFYLFRLLLCLLGLLVCLLRLFLRLCWLWLALAGLYR